MATQKELACSQAVSVHGSMNTLGGSGRPSVVTRLAAALRAAWRREPLLLATLAGVAAGTVLGVALSFADLPPLALDLIGLPGDLLMRTLKMLVLPLITASVMAGVCALRASTADMGKVARYTLLYYAGTTMGAVVLGIAIVNIIRPGRGSPFDFLGGEGGGSSGGDCHAANRQAVTQHAAAAGQRSPAEAFLGVVKSAFPDNAFAAAAGMNVLGIITVSLLMGAALSAMGPPASPLVELINVFNDAIAKIVNWVIWVSPLGIASLITTSICRACNLSATLAALGLFVLAVLLGLALWGFVVLPAIYFATTRRNPGQVYRGFSQAMATSFGTDSSSATLPITMRCAVQGLGCDPRVVQFFLPLGTTVNMNGTALYEAVTVIFIAQAHGVALGAAGTVIVALTATLAAVGAAGIPSAGLVTMLMVLQAVELDEFAGDIAIILAVDWFLDRCRTVVNVLGDAFGTVIIDHHARNWALPEPSPPSGAGQDPQDEGTGGDKSQSAVELAPLLTPHEAAAATPARAAGAAGMSPEAGFLASVETSAHHPQGSYPNRNRNQLLGPNDLTQRDHNPDPDPHYASRHRHNRGHWDGPFGGHGPQDMRRGLLEGGGGSGGGGGDGGGGESGGDAGGATDAGPLSYGHGPEPPGPGIGSGFRAHASGSHSHLSAGALHLRHPHPNAHAGERGHVGLAGEAASAAAAVQTYGSVPTGASMGGVV